MFYIIYQLTNKINGKTYVGMHSTNDIDDGYMGSGYAIKQAVAQYGIEAFDKTILKYCDNYEDMCRAEAAIVTEEYVLDPNTYNLVIGGKGGSTSLTNGMLGKRQSETQRQAASQWLQENQDKIQKPTDARKQHNRKLSAMWVGRKHTEETRRKMSESKKGHGSGKSNSQFGTRWITNGVENRKIKRTDAIPDGWRAGRNMVL